MPLIRKGPAVQPGLSGRKQLFHLLFLLLDHSAYHLSADGAGFSGSQIAVIAFLQVYTQLGSNLSLETVHSSLRFRYLNSIRSVGTCHFAFTSVNCVSFSLRRFVRRFVCKISGRLQPLKPSAYPVGDQGGVSARSFVSVAYLGVIICISVRFIRCLRWKFLPEGRRIVFVCEWEVNVVQ